MRVHDIAGGPGCFCDGVETVIRRCRPTCRAPLCLVSDVVPEWRLATTVLGSGGLNISFRDCPRFNEMGACDFLPSA